MKEHRWVTNRFLISHKATCFRVKICTVHYCTFKCSNRFHFVKQNIIKAREGSRDPKKTSLALDEQELMRAGI